MIFKDYTECILNAFRAHTRSADIIKRKHDILTGVAAFHNFTPNSVLYVGFNPAILADTTKNISVTQISQEGLDYLKSKGINFTYIPFDDLGNFYKKFDSVVALDEYFTFASTDNSQRDSVIKICNLAKEYVITTCKDYKNQDFKDREFSIPALIRGQNSNNIYIEFHDYDLTDRNSWQTNVYEIANNHLTVNGPFARRSMFFKQLAKFTSDAGAVGFSIHKNLMYKSLIKKNYEHVISIRFEHGS